MSVDIPRNSFKRALAKNQLQIGFWLNLASPTAAEIAAAAGFDWVTIDMEHAPFELPEVLNALRAMGGGTAAPLVRVPWNEPVAVKRVLDLGLQSVMFPMVRNADEARAAVAATRYPPHGVRGMAGGTRASGYGRIPDYPARCAAEICVIVQIETLAALNLIPEIAAVDGVDGLFIGPNDLAADLGIVGQRYAEKNKETILRGLKLIQATGKASGIVEHTLDEAMSLIKAGFTMVAVGSDTGLIARGTEQLVRTFKS